MRLALLLLLASAAFAQITYNRDIAPIFAAKCQACHRTGDIAPFALDNFETATHWKEDIKYVVSEGIMPPWKPAPGYGEFRGNFSLTEEEKRRIIDWVDTGGTEGDDPKPDTAAPRGDWVLGDPDAVFQMAEAYKPPRGKDMYRCFVIPTGFTEQKFVSAVDILPGDRKSVHHVILYLDTTGEAEKLDAADPGPGYTCFGGPGTSLEGLAVETLLGNGVTLGGWAPGTRPAFLPDGIGMHVPANARIVMQVHYYGRNAEAEDQTKIGLYYNKTPVDRRLIWFPLIQTKLNIPPGDSHYEAKAEFAVPPLLDNKVINVFPHMHLLGREIKVDAVMPDRKEVPLIYINNWDFNWQGPYSFMEPVQVPAFSRFRLSCTYDNTENNPRNPNNPVKNVRWGEGTEDEMCVAFLGVTFDRELLR
ncbi:MAG: hypothetical protein U0Q16_01815 [Bryobacteraceae bacterium]